MNAAEVLIAALAGAIWWQLIVVTYLLARIAYRRNDD